MDSRELAELQRLMKKASDAGLMDGGKMQSTLTQGGGKTQSISSAGTGTGPWPMLVSVVWLMMDGPKWILNLRFRSLPKMIWNWRVWKRTLCAKGCLGRNLLWLGWFGGCARRIQRCISVGQSSHWYGQVCRSRNLFWEGCGNGEVRWFWHEPLPWFHQEQVWQDHRR